MDTSECPSHRGHRPTWQKDYDTQMGIERSFEAEDLESRGLREAEERDVPEPLSLPEEEISEDAAQLAVLYATLEGKSGPVAIHKRTRLPVPHIERILNSPEFADMFVKAKRNTTQSAIDRLIGSTHQNIYILEQLRENKDPRVKMEAARDLLNRTPGMAPGAKVEIGTSEYMKMVERYLKKDDDGSTDQ